jgi:hypothetical protein
MGLTVSEADDFLMRMHSGIRQWPADKHDIVTVYEEMPGMTTEDRNWLVAALPNKLFSSPEEVINALPVAQKA